MDQLVYHRCILCFQVDDLFVKPVPSHKYGLLLASNPSRTQRVVHIKEVIGKGMALHLDATNNVGDSFFRQRRWAVDVLDHMSV